MSTLYVTCVIGGTGFGTPARGEDSGFTGGEEGPNKLQVGI